ncbi:MAG: type IV pilus secretin PilQ [Candidatus Aminicenantes bacterium]|nr:type IV pilus secretin PilQ [Candidatus Aminicenantes bacterium]
MKRYLTRFALPVAGLLLVLAGWSRQGQPLATIDKISVLPASSCTRIVLESGAPLQNLKAAYAKEFPSVLVVDLGIVQAPPAPALPGDGAQLVKDIKIQAAVDLRVSLFLTLREPVPFRIFTEAKRTVIELTAILRSGDSLVSSEVQEELKQPSRKAIALDEVEVVDKGDRVEVVARTGQKPIINLFALENPLRLVLDIYDAVFNQPTKTVPVGKYGLDKIRIGQYQTPPPEAVTRMVFDLNEPQRYTVANGPKELRVTLPGDPGLSSGAPPPTGKAETPISAPVPGPTAGQKADVKPAAKDVPPPAALKPAEKNDGPGAAAKKPTEAPPGTLPPAPADAPTKEAKKEPPAKGEKQKTLTIHDAEQKYAGELISPRFKDADLRDVVLWLGERAGLNVIFDPDVRGTVTCSFLDVPWDQFLDLILKNNKQGRSLEGNVLRIAPLGILAEEEKAQQGLRDAKEQSGPLMTKSFTLSYAKAKDILEVMKNKKSARGEIVTDERTNMIIITDVKEKIDLIENLIIVLDTPTQQVQIETRIVEATSTFVRNLGVQWGIKGVADPFYGNQTSLQFPNKIALDGALIPQGTVTKGIAGPLGGYAVNLPAPAFNSAIGVSFANVLDTFRLDLALSALETSGDGRIVSTQRVAAYNNKEAYINQGRQIPVQTQANFTVTTQYVNAGLELRATPQITADGTIIMTIDIQNNAADFSNLVNGIPPITTQSAKTVVGVTDGGTTVIGGIYRQEDAITRERVPFLHQIPILGSLFKSFSKTTQNRELLIFITPRILK